jgi:hypothetical protein
MFYLVNKLVSVTGNAVLLTGFLYLWQICITVTRIILLWGKSNNFDRNALPFKSIFSCDKNHYLWQVCTFKARNFPLITGKFVIRKSYFCHRKSFLVRENIVLQTYISFCVITAKESDDSSKDFLWGLRIFCHLGCQDSCKNPTLILAINRNDDLTQTLIRYWFVLYTAAMG